jgi:Flp pilus assembly protein TadG
MERTCSTACGARNRLRRGTALIEFCFLLPWYAFLFVGAFDFGFFSYSLIATTNAARVGALNCATSRNFCTAETICPAYVIPQLTNLPNIRSAVTTCTSAPLTVAVAYPAAAACPDGNACTTVTVTYVTPQLIPIPGLIPGQLTITKTTTMRLRKDS